MSVGIKLPIISSNNFEHFDRRQQSCEGYVLTGVCLSKGGWGVCLSACWDTTPRADPPFRSKHPAPPKSRHPAPQEQTSRHPPEQTPPNEQKPPPQKETPKSRHPPKSRDPLSRADTSPPP